MRPRDLGYFGAHLVGVPGKCKMGTEGFYDRKGVKRISVLVNKNVSRFSWTFASGHRPGDDEEIELGVNKEIFNINEENDKINEI